MIRESMWLEVCGKGDGQGEGKGGEAKGKGSRGCLMFFKCPRIIQGF